MRNEPNSSGQSVAEMDAEYAFLSTFVVVIVAVPSAGRHPVAWSAKSPLGIRLIDGFSRELRRTSANRARAPLLVATSMRAACARAGAVTAKARLAKPSERPSLVRHCPSTLTRLPPASSHSMLIPTDPGDRAFVAAVSS